MTLRSRNRIAKISFFATTAIIILLVINVIIAYFLDSIHPITSVRIPHFLDNLVITPYSMICVFLSIFMFLVYVPVMLYFIREYFENTQSSEIIFFGGFLLSCMFEGIRFLTPLYDLCNSYSMLFIFLSRLLYAGRLLAPISFIFAAILSDSSQRHEIERNFCLMIALPCVFAIIVPINSAHVSTTFEPTYGFANILNIARLSLMLLAFLSFLFSSFRTDTKELRYIAFDFVVLFSGYTVLTTGDNVIFLILGAALLGTGTYKYISNLHKLYMWK